MPSVVHSTRQYENNRAELSHQPIRQRERQMRRFKSAAHLQRFASVHGIVQNLFRVGRHLLRSWSPPAAAKPGVRRVGCGDVRLLTEPGRSAPRERTALCLPNLTVPSAALYYTCG